MTAKKLFFDDGSSLEWIDRESLRYEESSGYALSVWVDFEPGFFTRGRILHADSLDRWSDAPAGSIPDLPQEKKSEIVTKIRRYYGNVPLRLQPDK